MVKAIWMHETGGPEVLRWEEYEPGQPGPGEVLLRHEAVGLNFIDVYHRTGLYPIGPLPAIPGMEGAGMVEAIGEGVSEVAVAVWSLTTCSRVPSPSLLPTGQCQTKPTEDKCQSTQRGDPTKPAHSGEREHIEAA